MRALTFGTLITVFIPFLAQASEPTYTRDVAPILYAHCAGCHRPGDIAPMSLLTYKETRPWAAAIREAIVSRKMPPWKADPKIGHWSNDPSLTAEQVDIVKRWSEGQKLEGDAKDLPPAPHFTDGWKGPQPDAVFTIPEFKLTAKGPDEYSYITVPTNFKEDRWIVSAELRAGNRRVVHHAHVFVIDPADSKPKTAKAGDDPVAAYAKYLHIKEGSLSWIRDDAPVIDNGCSVDDNGLMPGSKSSDLGSLIASYLPGRAPDVYPEGTARRIPAGAVLNFQIHYSRATGKEEVDATSVGLVFSKEPPKQVSRRIDLSNQMFLVPAGDPDHAVSECHTFTKDVLVTSLTPHMHLRGKAMEIVADLPDGQKKVLLHVPEYDFNWQITYRAAEPIFLPKGTRIEVLGRFDNSTNKRGNPDPTKIVRWGSASENEMMDGWIEYVDAKPTAEQLVSSN